MTAILRETLTGVTLVDPEHRGGESVGAYIRLCGRQWRAEVSIIRTEEHTRGARWWAWAEGRLHDGDKHDAPLVGVRVGPVGMPSRRGAARSAIVEALSRLQDCAWSMVALVVPDDAVPTFIDPPAEETST